MSRGDSRSARLLDLAGLAARLAPGELDVLLLLAARAWVGQSRYGCLAVRRDPRDFAVEALEELADACFYLAAALARRSHARTSARSAFRRGGRHA